MADPLTASPLSMSDDALMQVQELIESAQASLKTANALRMTIPQSIRARVDLVIE